MHVWLAGCVPDSGEHLMCFASDARSLSVLSGEFPVHAFTDDEAAQTVADGLAQKWAPVAEAFER